LSPAIRLQQARDDRRAILSAPSYAVDFATDNTAIDYFASQVDNRNL
jgi:hypothetical protein